MFVKRYYELFIESLKRFELKEFLWTCFTFDLLHAIIVPFHLHEASSGHNFKTFFTQFWLTQEATSAQEFMRSIPMLLLSSLTLFFIFTILLNGLMYFIANKGKMAAFRYTQSYQLYLLIIFVLLTLALSLDLNPFAITAIVFIYIHGYLFKRSFELKTVE